MTLSSGLGCVNFETDVREDLRVRCGWMYYARFVPICGLFWSKTPPAYRVKKSAIFYDRRILGELVLLGRD